ncbi:MAG: ribose transport system permease protein [Spirochaetes bacterium]|nr:MAG: ribose transport system permease protein [Spirochaetota bacterium]
MGLISTVDRGVVLLHAMFIVSPLARQNLFGSAMIGEYFRRFIGYGVIALSLVLYAWKSRKAADNARSSLKGNDRLDSSILKVEVPLSRLSW